MTCNLALVWPSSNAAIRNLSGSLIHVIKLNEINGVLLCILFVCVRLVCLFYSDIVSLVFQLDEMEIEFMLFRIEVDFCYRFNN